MGLSKKQAQTLGAGVAAAGRAAAEPFYQKAEQETYRANQAAKSAQEEQDLQRKENIEKAKLEIQKKSEVANLILLNDDKYPWDSKVPAMIEAGIIPPEKAAETIQEVNALRAQSLDYNSGMGASVDPAAAEAMFAQGTDQSSMGASPNQPYYKAGLREILEKQGFVDPSYTAAAQADVFKRGVEFSEKEKETSMKADYQMKVADHAAQLQKSIIKYEFDLKKQLEEGKFSAKEYLSSQMKIYESSRGLLNEAVTELNKATDLKEANKIKSKIEPAEQLGETYGLRIARRKLDDKSNPLGFEFYMADDGTFMRGYKAFVSGAFTEDQLKQAVSGNFEAADKAQQNAKNKKGGKQTPPQPVAGEAITETQTPGTQGGMQPTTAPTMSGLANMQGQGQMQPQQVPQPTMQTPPAVSQPVAAPPQASATPQATSSQEAFAALPKYMRDKLIAEKKKSMATTIPQGTY